MSRQVLDLKQLYALSLSLIRDDRSITRALNWVDQVLPRFAPACRMSLQSGGRNDVEIWLQWIESESARTIAEAGKGEVYRWRQTWLRLLLETTRELQSSPSAPEFDRALARALFERHNMLPPCFTAAFWGDLIGYLRGEIDPKPLLENASDAETDRAPVTSQSPAYVVLFPLVLSEPVIDAGSETNVLLAQFVLEAVPMLTSSVYLHPEDAVVRCMDESFARCFQQAASVAQRRFRDSRESLPGVRVRVRTAQPGHERFLHGMVLRGASGAGALAVGLDALYHRRPSTHRNIAISFALCDPRDMKVDGACYAVGEADDKVRGCAKQGVRRLLVAEPQQYELALYGYKHGIEVIGAATFEEAAAQVLEAVQQVRWQGSQDDDRLVAELERALQSGGVHESRATTWMPVAGRPVPDDLEPFDGPVPLTSRFYVAREADGDFRDAVRQRHGIILIKGPRQVGKSSLLARGLDAASDLDFKTALTDFQRLSASEMQSPESFYRAVARMLARQLKLDASLEALWEPQRSANVNFEEYMEDHVLPHAAPLVWGMDEVDRVLLSAPFSNDVFGLFRSWANERQARSRSPWHGLTLIMAYATEAHLFIKDLNQSPFNIGTRFELRDFTIDEVADLNARYGSPLQDELDLARFHYLVGGHPYLVRCGLYSMVRHGIDIDAFEVEAPRDRGPIGDHLRRIVTLVAHNEENTEGLRDILRGLPCPSHAIFYALRSSGVVVGDAPGEARLRCHLYARYLERHLL
jgi:hypothetical protein